MTEVQALHLALVSAWVTIAAALFTAYHSRKAALNYKKAYESMERSVTFYRDLALSNLTDDLAREYVRRVGMSPPTTIEATDVEREVLP